MHRPTILEFYAEDHPYDPRRPEDTTFEAILGWTDTELEDNRDYIQWLFPLPERSMFNRTAPVLTKEVRDAFLEDDELRSRMLQAWERMMEFYGFRIEATDESDPMYAHGMRVNITRVNGWIDIARRSWLQPRSHNHLRITR